MKCIQCSSPSHLYYISVTNELHCWKCYERALHCMYCKKPTARVSGSFQPIAHAECIKKQIEQQGYIDMNEKMQEHVGNTSWTPSISTFNNLYLCCYTCHEYKPQQGTMIYEGMWMCADCQEEKLSECFTSVTVEPGTSRLSPVPEMPSDILPKLNV